MRFKHTNRKGFWYGFGLCSAVTLPLTALVYAFAPEAVGLFSRDAAVIAAGAGMTRYLSPLYIFLVVRDVLLGYLRGYGRSRMPMILSLIGMVVIRQIFLAVATARSGSLNIIYASFPLGWGAAMLLLLIYAAIVLKKMWREAESEGRAAGGEVQSA